jgi:hypothetical protein
VTADYVALIYDVEPGWWWRRVTKAPSAERTDGADREEERRDYFR